MPATPSRSPPDADVIDVAGHFIVPGYVDTHAHFRVARRVLDLDNWSFLANLAYGVTTALDVQPSTVDVLDYQDLIDAGTLLGPRALSTGPGIFNNNRFRSREHALGVLRRYKDHYRVRNLKAYIAGSRRQRQWLVQASKELGLMPTTEGALDMKLDMTHVIDGFSGAEHNFPVLDLHRDVVEMVARSGIGYTPTLVVSYGGPAGRTTSTSTSRRGTTRSSPGSPRGPSCWPARSGVPGSPRRSTCTRGPRHRPRRSSGRADAWASAPTGSCRASPGTGSSGRSRAAA